MLTEKHLHKTIQKFEHLRDRLKERVFIPVGHVVPTGLYQTKTPLNAIPDEALYSPLPENGKWGGEGVYGWFKGSFIVPEELDGKTLFAYPKMTYYEGTLWIDGCIHSNFTMKYVRGSGHGTHCCNRIATAVRAGRRFDFDLECYAHHYVPGTDPFENFNYGYEFETGPIDICVRDDELLEFVMDLETVISMRYAFPENSFRRAEIENALYQAHFRMYYDPDACDEKAFRRSMREVHSILKEQLSRKNGAGTPWLGLTGHSHMDTAWLWPMTETYKKCARTYVNQLNLMEEYPGYRFIQSSAYHSEIMRTQYPELFARIQKMVAEGRYEPNGGVWVECDCNLTGAESLVRQFVWGQRFTQKYFDYTADAFWLPDTFGYSFAIPQIMKGCRVDYFLTTKMGWNECNVFPYNSFYWQGLDGTKVLTHLPGGGCSPSPEALTRSVSGADPMRLFIFGAGDGGGGPEFEELEMAHRTSDLEGIPRSGYQSVSDFMHGLEESIANPNVYAGELYLELHRGTLTMHHEIKRLNRALEIGLHNLELATVQKAVREGCAADGEAINPLMNTLLVHQFHDILPGTSIHSVNVETWESMGKAVNEAARMIGELIGTDGNHRAVTLANTLSFDREDTVYIPACGAGVEDCLSQRFADLDGNEMLAVHGAKIPSFGAQTLAYSEVSCAEKSPFVMDGNVLSTPFARITFDENGFLASVIDLRNGRELVDGLPFGTLLLAEDVPEAWDNWDIDADLEDKFVPAAKLVKREIVSDGCVELRIRCEWKLSEKCSVRQDMIFSAHSPMIAFDTEIDWQEEHRFLKAAFDTSMLADGVRNEIQFGCIRRSNHRSTSEEKARFEVCNHKYSDMSENSYGITLLNDCKYGISVREGSMRLSLHKGGMRPDNVGDKGVHRCRYAILPHDEAFGAQSVVRPAYMFNYAPVIREGCGQIQPLAGVKAANIIIETVKPCEDAQNAYILRAYESVGDWTRTEFSFGHSVKGVKLCNMLEEEQGDADCGNIVFRPFEIKTIKVFY